MDKKIVMFSFCALMIIFVIASVIFAASFDCSKASTKTEKAICDDPLLSRLDEDMAAAYSKALKTSDRDTVRKGQRKWLKGILAPCIEDKVCIKKAYENRLRQLESSALAEPTPSQNSNISPEAASVGTIPKQFLGKWGTNSAMIEQIYGALEVKNSTLLFENLGNYSFVVVATFDDSVVLEMSKDFDDCGRYVRLGPIFKPSSNPIANLYAGSLNFAIYETKNGALAPKKINPYTDLVEYPGYCTWGLFNPLKRPR